MRIKGIHVQGLFGIFDHDIDMKLDDRITIVLAPNGYGKTTILRMVDGLFNRRYSDLRHTPFQEFKVDLEDGSSILVTKSRDENGGQPGKESRRRRAHGLIVKLKKGGKEAAKGDILAVSVNEWEAHAHFPINAFEQFIPGLVRETRDTWRYMPSNEELGLEDVIERFGDQFPPGLPEVGERKQGMEWLHAIQKSVKVRLIESQRLIRLAKIPRRSREFRESSTTMELSVAVNADHLAKAIQGTLTEYATLSQSLDRTFPVRLVEEIQSPKVSKQRFGVISDVRQKLTELEDKRTRLQEAGLLDKQEDLRFQVPEELQEPTQRVLPVYVADVEQKLSVFDDIAAKIDLLKDIVNSHFTYKKMSIDKEKGFRFRTEQGQPLDPSHLSSGEQHMLIVFYELLFRVEPNSLVMIDEPEISLHVTWQLQFLRDIERVTKLALFDVLMATHSPQIVHDRMDDLTVELQGKVEQPA